MDYRKLIAFSKGSFVVTIPKPWIEKHNLKKGNIITIEEGSDELVLYAGEKEIKREERSISINTENKNLNRIKAEIVSAYLNNYNTIEIFSETLENDAPIIKNVLRNLSGMEIIEQTGKRIVAKDLIDLSSISIQSIIRRMDVITRSMIEDTTMCLQGKCNPKSISHRDEDVNRLYYLGFRVIKNAMEDPVLTNKLKTTHWRLSSDRRLLSRIEEIADRQKRISREIEGAGFSHKGLRTLKQFNKAIEEFKELSDDIKKRYCNAMKAYYTCDKKSAYEIETTNEKYIVRCDKFLQKITKNVCSYCTNNAGSNVKLTDFPGDIVVSVSKISEHTKATLTFIKIIARTVLSMDQ